MARNIEIKARARDWSSQKARAAALAKGSVTEIHQEDHFYQTVNGRLKLRVFNEEHGELIAYRRPNQEGPKTSHYEIYRCTSPGSLKRTLDLVPGCQGSVIKVRHLFLTGRTRIHFDEVRDLGGFIELEVVLQDGELEADGLAEARSLMASLDIKPDDLIDAAYIDLILTESD